MKLALGTAQFGLEYGIANRTGQVRLTEAASIVARARHVGIQAVDTAIAYGKSEQILGNIGIAGLQVMTKLPGVPADCENIGAWVDQQLEASLRRLRINKVSALLLHRPSQLHGHQGKALYKALMAVKASGRAEKIGVSVYHPEELDPIFPALALDIVQAPFNVFDRRLQSSGWMDRLAAHHVELNIRSIFLQGLLLLGPDERPKYFNQWATLLNEWDKWCAGNGVSRLVACVQFAVNAAAVSKVVVGVETVEQLDAIVAASALGSLPLLPKDLNGADPNLLDPSRWKNDD